LTDKRTRLGFMQVKRSENDYGDDTTRGRIWTTRKQSAKARRAGATDVLIINGVVRRVMAPLRYQVIWLLPLSRAIDGVVALTRWRPRGACIRHKPVITRSNGTRPETNVEPVEKWISFV